MNREAKPLVLITGSQGRIGRAIAAALGERYTIVGFERECRKLDDSAPACINADIASPASIAEACQTLRESYGGHLASVIHLAAFYDFSGEPDPRYAAVNVDGTRHLLHALREFTVDQFIYASTMLVHAPSEPGVPIDENSPLAAKWPYPESKLAAEAVVRSERGRIPVAILRLAGVYTDDCEVPSLAYQIQRIYERQMLSHVFPGDPAHGQTFVHLDDAAAAFRLAIEARGALPAETTLLIGEPATESYASLQNLIGRLVHGEPWATRRIPKPLAATGAWAQDVIEAVIPDAIDRGIEPFVKPFMVWLADDHYELDIASATHFLGWQPTHSLRGTLPAIVGRLKQHPADWYRRNHIPLPVWLDDLAAQPQPEARLIDEHQELARRDHQRTLWCHFANSALGLWLASSPFIFGLSVDWLIAEEPAPDSRGIELSDTWMTASDVVTGLLICAAGLLSLSRRLGWARWLTAALGTWLLFAPLIFWTTSAAAYANDTLVGALVIVFAIGVPEPPGISPVARLFGPDAPPGWSFSPSAWNQRIPIIALALVGLFISRYLAAFQLGHLPGAWDPFFGSGTETIVTSSVSQAWPVADAGLGAATYVLEIVTGVLGDKRRWRTLPWLVLLFGLMIVPLGAVSLFFIVIQPIVIGTWCTLCLVAAAAMLLQIPYSCDEILATLQFLAARRRAGRRLWQVLVHGDTMEGGSADYSDDFEAPPKAVFREMLAGGVTVPWTLAASAALGIALMCTRLLFATTGTAAANDHATGAIVVTVSIIALGEVVRPLRFANAACGVWLLLAPWLLSGYTAPGTAFASLTGALLIALSLPRGAVLSRYGAWDSYIRIGDDWCARLRARVAARLGQPPGKAGSED